MGNLHQLLAVKKEAQQRANEVESETKKVFGAKHLFQGSIKSYQSFDDDENIQVPDEHEALSYTVGEKMNWFAENFGKLMDIEFQIDLTNEEAIANLEVGSFSLADVPATYLLDLIGFLDRVRKVYSSIPVLDPKYQWESDSQGGPGVFEVTEPEVTFRSKKILRHKVLYEATDHHPAQVEKWPEDIQIGKYTRRIWSGALTAAQKATVLGRVDKLIEASKKALAEANNAKHSQETIASKVFNFLHEGIPIEGILRNED